eukprot:790300_1
MHHSKVSSKHAITSANIHIASNVGIHDVVSHIVPALMASWCTTLLALGDFCQYLIDLFIPSKWSTLANVFSICLLIGDEYLKIGTMKAPQLFVPRFLINVNQWGSLQK